MAHLINIKIYSYNLPFVEMNRTHHIKYHKAARGKKASLTKVKFIINEWSLWSVEKRRESLFLLPFLFFFTITTTNVLSPFPHRELLLLLPAWGFLSVFSFLLTFKRENITTTGHLDVTCINLNVLTKSVF